jgi:hypothetical protein
MQNFLGVLAILFFLAFCVKVCLNAFASNVQSTASIVQYSVLTLCLLIPFGHILIKWLSIDNMKNANTALFLVGIAWVLGNVLAFIALNGRDIDMLNLGRLNPSINGAINVYWIIIPQFILIFYNWKLLMDCSNQVVVINPCSKVTWITLIILSFALIQTYLIVDSSRVIQTWPTDDGRRNIPRIQL